MSCPQHGNKCHALCRFRNRVRRLGELQSRREERERTVAARRQQRQNQIQALNEARARVMEARKKLQADLPPDPVPEGHCPIHRHFRHPRICRFCRSVAGPDAPPLAPSEDITRETITV